MNHVQRAAQDSHRDEVGDPHSTAEGKCVDVGDVGQRRLQEHKSGPGTRIGRRTVETLYGIVTVRKFYRKFEVGNRY